MVCGKTQREYFHSAVQINITNSREQTYMTDQTWFDLIWKFLIWGTCLQARSPRGMIQVTAFKESYGRDSEGSNNATVLKARYSEASCCYWLEKILFSFLFQFHFSFAYTFSSCCCGFALPHTRETTTVIKVFLWCCNGEWCCGNMATCRFPSKFRRGAGYHIQWRKEKIREHLHSG